jgi:chromosomal replication initiator protein
MIIGTTVLRELKAEINEIDYKRYIKQLKFKDKLSNSYFAVYEAPNILIASWVKTKYKSKIESLFENITGNRYEVDIITKKSSKKRVSSNTKNIPTSQNQTLLNPSYTFENFVMGSSNQFAFTTAKSVSQKPGILYNPLLIYGGTGLGKTHLLQAIGNYNIGLNKNVIYVTSEQFLNEFISTIKQLTPTEKFREKFRKCDILLIDDVQFFSGKEGVQEEFFHTFNELHQNKAQIVLTSDKPPKKIAGLDDRLKSRFEFGLTTEIQSPELETKIGIIQKKCELNKIDINSDVINYLASNLGENIREIEGAIIKINAMSSVINKPIDIELAKNILKDNLKENTSDLTLETIISLISSELNVKPSEIKSKSRVKKIADARAIVIYMARQLTPNSTPKLAKFFSMKDHSSVSKAETKIKNLIKNDENFKLFLDNLKNTILNN